MAAPTGGSYKRGVRLHKVAGKGGGRGANKRKSMIRAKRG